MNKKLYLQLLVILISNCSVNANNVNSENFFKTVGRTLSSNGNSAVAIAKPTESISFSDAKDLKKQMKGISKDISRLSVEKKDEVRTQVIKLADLVKKNQVATKKGKVKKSTNY